MVYEKPFPKKIKTKIAKPKGIYAHEKYPESKFAVDFILDVNTSILASRTGTVIKIKSDSNKVGLDPKLVNKVNFVVIDYSDGTYAECLHFEKDKVVVKKGQKVKRGDLLGYSGLSSAMDLPHLHFNIFKIKNKKAISIPFKIKCH